MIINKKILDAYTRRAATSNYVVSMGWGITQSDKPVVINHLEGNAFSHNITRLSRAFNLLQAGAVGNSTGTLLVVGAFSFSLASGIHRCP